MTETRLQQVQSQRLSQGLQTALHLLSGNLDDLSYEMREAVQENPALELVQPDESAPEIAVRLRMGYVRTGGAQPEPGGWESPMEALEQQLRFADLPQETYRAALGVLHSLNPRGYFIQPLREFAAEAGITPELAKEALHAVQALEPAGIGARDVAECLTLQLAARPQADPLCAIIVRGYLMELSRKDYSAIAAETHTSAARVRRCAGTIASLTPAPVSLSEEPVHYIVPEFAVERDGDNRLSTVFVSRAYPGLRIDPGFARLAAGLTGDEAAYARDMLDSATRLLHAIDLRQSTMEKLAALIVGRQRAFFLSEYSLVPLTAAEAAAELGISESTVYRALRDKYLWCSRGTFPLSHFFQQEVSSGVSRERVRELIAEICGGQGKISDRAIAEELLRRGITISRRTVAKYRAQLGIDSSFERNPPRGDKT